MESADPDGPTSRLLGGREFSKGDMVMHKDPESKAWWRAEALDFAENRVLLHYVGCDTAWDTWVEINDLTLMHMDPDERAKDAAGAFQSLEYEASLDDAEVLRQMRQQRWDDNARWQLSLFGRCARTVVERFPAVFL